MKTLKLFSLMAFLISTLNFANAQGVSEYNLSSGNLALQGYDPVAYHPEAEGAPTKGNSSISLEHEGVLYYFASTQNQELFKSNPEKYAPAFGGWCAFAMANGSKVDPNLNLYKIQDGRLLLFIQGTKARWEANVGDFTFGAVENWFDISDEETIFF